jgi:Sec-independent protein translocase protein TatA
MQESSFAPRDDTSPLSAPRARGVPWRSIAFVALMCAASLIALSVAIAARRELGALSYALYCVSALAAAALLLFGRRKLPHRALLRRSFRARRAELTAARRELAESRTRMEADLQQAAERLAEREQQLNHRLTTFHEWMEFPQPIQVVAVDPIATDSVEQLAEKDRQLLTILERSAQRLFEGIQQNRYVQQGQFQPLLLRDDALELIQEVARLYRPAAHNPLLETSLEQILRSASRVCLQMLIVMERLPLNVKEYNLSSMYRYVRQAVKAYDWYKAAEPYWPYVNTAYFLGRFALGANPVALGAWWFVGQRGKKLAGDFASQVVQRQVLTLLRDVVRVVGYETAAVYGGDFRHRDPHWIYAVELVELLKSVPLAPESFSCALQEIGTLELRSEYDRVFLYRCLAAAQSADPARYHATQVLSSRDRQALAHRLETFSSAFRLRGGDKPLADWARGVEERLDVKLRVAASPLGSVAQQRQSALRSLAGYLLEVKLREPQELATLLASVRVAAPVSAAAGQQWLAQLAEDPPYFFSPPDVDPDGETATQYLEDLIQLAVHIPPHLAQLDIVLANAAAYLRRDPDQVRQRVDDACRILLEQRCSPDRRLPPRLAPEVVRAVLDLLADGEQMSCLFSRIRLEQNAGQRADWAERLGQLWLVGVADRLVLFAVTGEQPRLLWVGRHPVPVERVDSWTGIACRLTGGEWADEAWNGTSLVVSGPPWKRFTDYFRDLLQSPAAARPV